MKPKTTEVPRSGAGALQFILAVLIFSANVAAVYVAFGPLEFRMPDNNLDLSWMAVLGEASAHGWRFGRDIIFTSGPLSAVYTRWFSADRLDLYLAANVALIVTFSLLVSAVVWRSRTFAAGFLVAAGTMFCSFVTSDAIFVAHPLLVALVVLSPDRGIFERLAIALGLLCAALLTLAKFVIFPAAIVTFILCDIAAIVRRRWPIFTLGYLVLWFGLFAWLEGPRWFLQYAADSIDLASGYTEAMSVDGRSWELVAFVAAAAGFLAVIGWAEARSNVGKIPTIAWLRWLVLATYLFVMFRGGFVRHDGHSLGAWTALALAALIYPCRFGNAGIMTSLLCSAVAAGLLVSIPDVYFGSWPSPQDNIPRIEREFTLAADFVSQGERQIAQWQRAKEEAWARVRAKQELPPIKGTVDVIPSIQASLLAWGLDYQPRYSFQEYLTFTNRLIEANRRKLIEHGPDFLLFAPGSIDQRFPSLAEGPLWPDILAAYAPVSDDGKLLLMRRRSSRLDNLVGAESQQTISFGRAVGVPAGPQFLRARIKKTLLGRLIDVLFRPPIVWMTVGFSDGTMHSFRIIPAIVEAGFLISPWVPTTRDFLTFVEGRTDLSTIQGITFETSRFGQYVYDPEIEVSFSPLSREVLQRAAAMPEAFGGADRHD